MPDKASSYLASVKDELRSVVEEISQEEKIDTDGIVNRIWRLFEAKLKESFRNGQNMRNGSNAEKRNAWRR